MGGGFSDRLAAAIERTGTVSCVGIDPHLERLAEGLAPEGAPREVVADGLRRFGLGVVDAVADLVPAVKPQSAFFEALGAPGVAALEAVCAAAQDAGLLVVLDVKRGDIGSTAAAYARATLDAGGMGADCLTVSPYLGPESMAPFLDRAPAKGMFVLVRTSNPGAGAWQLGGEPALADRVAAWIEASNAPRLGACGLGPVGAVVGATLDAAERRRWRAALPHSWILAPGFGAQGAGPADLVELARPGGGGLLVPVSRAVLFPAGGHDGIGFVDAIRARTQALVRSLAGVR
jgi:orotidine-5'-phosphate decarboxylase